MNRQLLASLQAICVRVNVERTERILYSHDTVAMPLLVQTLLGKPMADAIVQPQSEQELVALVRWANQHHVPLTPRGKASSGNGSVLPVKNGVIVDFAAMTSVLYLDPEALLVTVQPGITWEQLDCHLQQHGLTLRLYPTSYPSSTVGGWLAQGGAGPGSYQYGYFHQNVVSACVILPNGTIRTFMGSDLGLIAEAEGITGIVSQITLRVMPILPLEVFSVGVKETGAFQTLVEAIAQTELPIWSVGFISPNMAGLKNQVQLAQHCDAAILPASYILTLAYPQAEAEVVHRALAPLIEQHEAERLGDEIARQEWGNRFQTMSIKRLAPSLAPVEFVVPLSKLGKTLEEMGDKIGPPLIREGLIVRRGSEYDAVILAVIPTDERRLDYNFVFALALSMIKIAEKHGGRAYSTGLYFSHRAYNVFGKERVERLRKFKAEIDPHHLMNPGKVIETGFFGTLMILAETFEPVTRAFGNAVTMQIGERTQGEEEVRGIPPEMVWYSYACAQCGFCLGGHELHESGWESQTLRGRWYWLREYLEGREKVLNHFPLCTTCQPRDLHCPTSLPTHLILPDRLQSP